eukprot:TRINITY_DN25582_c0_g1_i2.p1 TRINITY_DN25582_c0_g1~~TRINITY_DN25582_c0_g1_i2.p1  ORF type:complete len:240 (+),score=50.40 TRINITY_DN25582_c0_g1_i2:175-894(+)
MWRVVLQRRWNQANPGLATPDIPGVAEHQRGLVCLQELYRLIDPMPNALDLGYISPIANLNCPTPTSCYFCGPVGDLGEDRVVRTSEPFMDPSKVRMFTTIRNRELAASCVAYYEVRIGETTPGGELVNWEDHDQLVGIGWSARAFPHFGAQPGWKPGSFGYHGDDGHKYSGPRGEAYGPKYGKGDVVGAGIDCKRQQVFFTLNGQNLGPAYLSLIHISEPTRLLSISYAVFCLKKKKK